MSVPPVRVLVVDDDRAVVRAVSRLLEREGMALRATLDPTQALPLCRRFEPDVVLLDLRMPRMDGITVLREIKRSHLTPEVIILTGVRSTEAVVETIKLGAYWFLDKPFDSRNLLGLIRRAAERRELGRRVREARTRSPLIGDSAVMERLRQLIRKVANDPVTVLITGESGTGKEVTAREVHAQSERSGGPFVAINCGAIPAGLLESELFGHVRGAFTDAHKNKAGVFERAKGGTLFLDEVTELPLTQQVSLLRVLQEREVRPVGSSRAISVDVRMVAATNRDPWESVREGRLREDLYYRLNVFPIHLPPLRDRTEDIPLLCMHFLRKALEPHTGRTKSIERFSPEAMDALQRYDWRGNVRQLANVVERAVVICDGPEIGVRYLPEQIRVAAGLHLTPLPASRTSGAGPSEDWRSQRDAHVAELDWRGFRDSYLSEVYRSWLSGKLQQAEGNRAKAARQAGVDRANFRKLLRKHGVEEGGGGGGAHRSPPPPSR